MVISKEFVVDVIPTSAHETMANNDETFDDLDQMSSEIKKIAKKTLEKIGKKPPIDTIVHNKGCHFKKIFMETVHNR